MAVFEHPLYMNEMNEEYWCSNCDATIDEDQGDLCENCFGLAVRLYMTLAAFLRNEGYNVDVEEGVDESLVQATSRLFGHLLERQMEEEYVYTVNPEEFLPTDD